MKHSIDYYIEHIEPMIDNLNRQQEIQIDNTKFLVLKVRTTYKKPSKLGVPHIRFITYIRKTTKKK